MLKAIKENVEIIIVIIAIVFGTLMIDKIQSNVEHKKFISKQTEIIKIIEARLNKIDKLNNDMKNLANNFDAEYEKVSTEKNEKLLKEVKECKDIKELENIIEDN